MNRIMMIRTRTAGLIFLLSLFAFFGQAQNITLGTRSGASANAALVTTNTTAATKYSRAIAIYSATELINAGAYPGRIYKIYWNKEGTGEYTPADANIQVYMKHVTNATHAATPTWATEVTGATLVYSNAAFSIPTGTGWKEIVLATPFDWNGTDNIEVFVDWYKPLAPTADITWAHSAITNTNAISTGTTSAPATSTRNGNRPIMQLELVDTGATDAAVKAFTAPSAVFDAGSAPVSINIKNQGGKPINDVIIDIMIDNVLQTPVNHTFPSGLASLQNATVSLGNYIFPVGIHTIKVWTKSPNGFTDANRNNDTISMNVIAKVAMNGTYTINPSQPNSGTNFTSFANAINMLNAGGISGTVYFDVAAGTAFNESNLLITATGTATDSIVFRKSGAGKNPSITATAGASTTRDFIIGLEGADYIVFDGIDVQDTTVANASTTQQMEWGYALFRKSATDGAQHNTIRNSRIELKRARTSGIGIYSINQAAAASAAVEATSVAGANSFNNFYSDSLINCYSGIVMTGTNDSNYYDEGNQVGVAGGNTILNFGGTSTSTKGIHLNYHDNAIVANNTLNSGTGHTSGIYGIHAQNGLNSNIDIYNNTVTVISTSSSGMYGIANDMGHKGINNAVNIHHNTLTGCYNGSTGTPDFSMIMNNATANVVNINNNVIENDSTNSTASIYVIYNNPSGTGNPSTTSNIHHNIIRNVKRINATTGGNFYGMYNSPLINGSISNIYENKIYNVGNTAGTGITAGMNLYGSSNQHIYKNHIYNILNEGATATSRAMGINILGVASAGCNFYFYNNYISNVLAPRSASLDAVTGISVSVGAANAFAGLYHNTIYLDSTSVSKTFGSAGVLINSITSSDLRNNIIVNRTRPGDTMGIVAAYKRTTTALATYSDSSNRNIFHVSNPGNRSYVFYDGTDSAITIGAFKSKMVTRDQASIGAAPQFVNTTTAPYDLRIDGSVPTPVESAGRPVLTPVAVTTDFDGNTRDPQTPDIGANEGSFVAADVEGPAISYTALKNTGSILNRTLVVSISDVSGVDSSAFSGPRLYFRRNGSGYLSVAATSRAGNNFTFTIDYSMLGGISVNDVIDYYIAAQDLSPLFNPATSPDGGGGSNPPGYSAPLTPSSYTVLPALSGTYYVGASAHTPAATYLTLKDALLDYKTKGMSSAVEFILIDSAYNTTTGETFPLLIEENPDASPANTLTIKPETGVNVRIAGVAAVRSSIIKLSGADHVTINGMNANNTSLTIINQTVLTHLDSMNAVVWMSSAGPANGANFNTIKNCNIHGVAPKQTQAAIYLGTAIATGYNQFVESNSNGNLIDSNYISKAQFGVILMGASAVSPAADNKITNNKLGTASAGDGFYQQAVFVNRQNNVLISNNEIQNVFSDEPSNSDDMYGINLVNCRNAVVSANKIHNMKFTGSTFTLVMGISSTALTYKTVGNPSNNVFYNNAVYDLSSTSTAYEFNTGGINLSDGYGDKVYFNTVYLTGQLSSGNGPSAAFSNGYNTIIGNSPTYGNNIDVRNNIFAVTGTTGTSGTKKLYAHYSKAPNYASGILNNNVLYINATAPAVGFTGALNGADYTTLAAWQTATANESNSLDSDPQLNTPVVVIPQSTSPAIGAGTPVSGITLDIKGALRNTTAPSIGAYEAGGDYKGPVIVSTPLKNTTLTTNVTATDFAGITDNSGVNVTPGTKPRIYYKKAGDLNAFNGNTAFDNGWKYTEATNAVSPFSFVIDYSLIYGGVAYINDTIQYFTVAQDNVPAPNVGSTADLFNAAQSVNLLAANFPVANFKSYRIIQGAQGYVYVGAGHTYLTLTDSAGLFDALKNSLILTGDMTVLITSDLAENGKHDLSGWQEEGAGGYKLTIRPDQNIQRVISGNVADGMIRLNKARKVTFDGIDTVSGTGRYLRFVNLNTSNPVFTFINDAVYDTIRNCVIEGASTSSSNGLVFFSTATSGGNNFNAVTDNIISNAGAVRYNTAINSTGSSLNKNNSNTLSANVIRNFSGNGIYISSNNGDQWKITGNTLYDSILPPATTDQTGIEFMAQSKNNTISNNQVGVADTTWYTSGNNAFVGIVASFDVNGVNEIRNNTITNIERTGTTTAATFTGIRVTRGTVTVDGNMIGDSMNTAKGIRLSSPAISTGIDITSTVANANIVISNNHIAGMLSAGTGATTRLRGISYSNTSTSNTIPLTVTANRIHGLMSYSQATGLAAGEQSVTAISMNPNTSSGTYAEVNISNNTIYDLVAGNTSDTPTVALAMMLNNVKGNVNANRMYSIRNYSTRDSETNPAVSTGILLRATEQVVISNNMITVGSDTTDNIQYIGIWNPVTAAGARLYHNSIAVLGFNYSSVNAYAVYRGTNNPADQVNTPFNGNNNLFTSHRYGLHSYTIGSNGASGFGNQSWNNNVYFCSDPTKLGRWNGTQGDLFTWQTNSQKDTIAAFVTPVFVNPSIADLHLSGGSVGNVQFVGITLPNITKDFDGETRHVYPYAGADEVTSAPLPVKLVSFNAAAVNADVHVQWTTSSERNVAHFVVEASADGRTFIQVGRVAAKGNSSAVTSYSFKHANAQRELGNTSVAYYRLRSTDLDGSTELSKVAQVRFNGNDRLLEAATAYPNPFSEQVLLSIPATVASAAQVEIVDIQGKLVQSSKHELSEGMNTITLTGTQALHEGIYFVRLTTADGIKVMKIIKQ